MSTQRRLILLWIFTVAAIVAAFFHQPLIALALYMIACMYQLGLPRPQLSRTLQLFVLAAIFLALGAAWAGRFPILQAALWIASGVILVCLTPMSIRWQIRLFRDGTANRPSA